ncbi:FecR family protein [Foetidibacter luteolus]|uniref:FecR family protein n=1 Tax=Foetidibacter luteolus TaxID=2608880 RepID=UPI00129B94DA|nr:FecR family protein [Foetidibacter luteolus]
MEPSNSLWVLMARGLSREITPDEHAELVQHLSKNPQLQQQYDIISRLWAPDTQPHAEEEVSEEDRLHVARILQIAKKKQSEEMEDEPVYISPKQRRRRLLKRVSAVSLVLAAVWAFVFYWKAGTRQPLAAAETAPQKIAVQNGSRTRSILPDGSTVWVNAGSSVTFTGDFSGPLREVKLEGEAYFDVVKNPAKPFIVHTGGISIKVLGTAFNVKAYPADKTVETTLIHGLVQVTRQNDPGRAPIFLHPNEKLVVEKSVGVEQNLPAQATAKQPLPPYQVTHLDTTLSGTDLIETAWLYNRLAFRGENFEALAQKLERWYNIKIVFEDSKVRQLNFNGSFENETVEQAFTALKAAVPFNFKIHAHEVFISSPK